MTTEPSVDPAEQSGLASWSVMERLGRILHVREAALQPTLDAIARAAVETIAAAEYAGVNLFDRGCFVPQAVAGEPALALDVLQQETGMGPCIDASRDQVTVRVEDLAAGCPWPGYAELAISLGIRSQLCVPLWVDEQQLGSVSLFATVASGFTASDEVLARLFGTQAALVLADASRAEQLRQAMATRDSIGQAKGILMERHRITADQAFAVLSGYSQRTNRRLAEVARHLAETGQLDLSRRHIASQMPGEEGKRPGRPVTRTSWATGTLGGGEDDRLLSSGMGSRWLTWFHPPRLPAPAMSRGRLLALRSGGPTRSCCLTRGGRKTS